MVTSYTVHTRPVHVVHVLLSVRRVKERDLHQLPRRQGRGGGGGGVDPALRLPQ